MLAASPISASHCSTTSGASALRVCRATIQAQAGRARSGSRMHRRLLAIPGDGPLEPLAQRRLRLEPELPLRPRGIEAPARLAVRHRLVPDDPAFEVGQLRDELGELSDRDLLRRADV